MSRSPIETLALFVRFWLTTTPPLPEPAQAAAPRQGRRALRGLRRGARAAAWRKGPKLPQEISEDIAEGRRRGDRDRLIVVQVPPFACLSTPGHDDRI